MFCTSNQKEFCWNIHSCQWRCVSLLLVRRSTDARVKEHNKRLCKSESESYITTWYIKRRLLLSTREGHKGWLRCNSFTHLLFYLWGQRPIDFSNSGSSSLQVFVLLLSLSCVSLYLTNIFWYDFFWSCVNVSFLSPFICVEMSFT